MDSWCRGSTSALRRGPICWRRSEKAFVRSSAENSRPLSRWLSSAMDAKKTSAGIDAILPCLELESRLRGHGQRDGVEGVDRVQNAFPSCLELVGRRRLRGCGDGRRGDRGSGKLAAGQLHLFVIPIEG